MALIRQIEGEETWWWLAALLSVVGIYAAADAIRGLGAVLPFSAFRTGTRTRLRRVAAVQ